MAITVGVIGTGAVGGYYGGMLARSGYETHFLLHRDYEQVRQNGLVVESCRGDFKLESVFAYARATDMPRCDLVLVALKTTANESLSDILPAVVKTGGLVLVLQNGLDVEADVQQIVPEATVLGGLCFLCSHKVGPGHIRHLDYGAVRIGEYRPDGEAAGLTPALQTVLDMFQAAGLEVSPAEDLGLARWQKLVWNMPFNGLSVILAATTDRMMADPSVAELIRRIMAEVTAAAAAHGHDLGTSLIDNMLTTTAAMVAYSPSMKLDFEARRPLEIGEIYHRPLQAAARKKVSMPRTAVIAGQLDFLDRSNRNAGN